MLPMRRFVVRSFAAIGMLFVSCHGTTSQVRVIRKPHELDQAIEQGVQHIVIVEHLDLSAYPSKTIFGGGRVLFAPQVTTKSITVREQ
jgi:hypothetical protein